MHIKELIAKHGFNIWISRGMFDNQPFQVLAEKYSPEEKKNVYLCRFEDGREFTQNDHQNDYHLADKPQKIDYSTLFPSLGEEAIVDKETGRLIKTARNAREVLYGEDE